MKRPYTGYIREIFTYTTYPIRPKKNPDKKFFILTFGRSGSNLLVSILSSHPLIHCDNELLWKRVALPEVYLKCHERLSRKDVYGFKLLSSHFDVQKIAKPKAFIEKMCSAGYQIISLKRRNAVRQAVSHIYASYRDKFHHLSHQGEQKFVTMNLDLDEFQKELQWIDNLNALEDMILVDFPFLRLYYEDDLNNPLNQQVAVDHISEYLGIPSAGICTNLVKTTPDNLAQIIENYADIKTYLATTKYATMME